VIAGITSWLQAHVLSQHGLVVYLVVGTVVFLEVAILIGVFIPGEIAAIVGGVAASQHRANVVLMVATVVVTASAGNACGFEIGQLIGPWLRSHRPLRTSRGAIRAEQLIARRGGPAVLVGRFILVVRALVPGIAGMSAMKRHTFLPFATAGAALWGLLWVLVGWGVGLSYTRIVNDFGRWALILVAAAAVAMVAWHLVRRRRERRRSLPAG